MRVKYIIILNLYICNNNPSAIYRFIHFYTSLIIINNNVIPTSRSWISCMCSRHGSQAKWRSKMTSRLLLPRWLPKLTSCWLLTSIKLISFGPSWPSCITWLLVDLLTFLSMSFKNVSHSCYDSKWN